MKRLYFVRHGQSQANVDHVYGQAKTPLTTLGRQQAEAAGSSAKALGIQHIVSSPYSRAYDTATIIATHIGIDPKYIETNSLLVERNYGTLVGKPWADVSTAEGVESVDVLLQRGRQALAYLETLPQDIVLVVGHGTFFGALMAAIDSTYQLIEGREPANAEIVQLI